MVPHKSRAGVKQKHCLQTIFLTDWNRHAEHLLLLLGTPWRKSQVPLQKHLRLCKSVVTIKKNSSKPTYRGLADWFTSFKEASSIPGIIWPSSSELLNEINSGTTRHRPSAEGCLSVAPSFQGNRLHQDFENSGISFPPFPILHISPSKESIRLKRPLCEGRRQETLIPSLQVTALPHRRGKICPEWDRARPCSFSAPGPKCWPPPSVSAPSRGQGAHGWQNILLCEAVNAEAFSNSASLCEWRY